MTLRRFCHPVDGTIPAEALVLENEEILAKQEGVGIYDGFQKSPNHQNGTVYTTSLRLIYIDAEHPATCSFALDLSRVTQTDYYGGLFKSSAKITLYLRNPPTPNESSGSTASSNMDPEADSWECEVCGNRNKPALVALAKSNCVLCGVPRPSPSVAIPPRIIPPHPNLTQLSKSLPASPRTVSVSSSPSPSVAPWTLTSTQTLSGSVGGKRPSSVACPVCTFLNHPYLRECELCSTPLPTIQKTSAPPPPLQEPVHSVSLKSAPTSRPASPDPDDDMDGNSNMIKVSFRKGGDKAFYAILRRGILGQAWESKASRARSPPTVSGTGAASDLATAGISGILNTVQLSTEAADVDMKDSLKDLEALMIKARDMVRLAKDLNDRLTAASSASTSQTALLTAAAPSSAVEPEEATFIRSSLAQLGLQMEQAPVTQDMMKDERRWLEELARELGGVLQTKGKGEGMMQKPGRGIMALDEVWGGWNRARGVALIPTSTFLQVLPLLAHYTEPPIHLRTFASGLRVLHIPAYSTDAFSHRLVASISARDDSVPGATPVASGKTLTQIAQEEGLTVSLAAEMVGAAELAGSVCRDEANWAGAGGEVRWCVWAFEGYEWDGHVFSS